MDCELIDCLGRIVQLKEAGFGNMEYLEFEARKVCPPIGFFAHVQFWKYQISKTVRDEHVL